MWRLMGLPVGMEAIDIPIESSDQDLPFDEGWRYLFPFEK